MALGTLLDTCAALWLSARAPMASRALAAMSLAAEEGRLFISPITAWEVGNLCARGRLTLHLEPLQWFETMLAQPGIAVAPLTPEILVASTQLPGDVHKDPADRIVIATARFLGLPVVTRDGPILAYADQGHVEAIPC